MNRIYSLLFLLINISGFTQPFNNVVLLNGVDDFIEVPNNFSSNFSNDLTIEAWVKPCAINGHRIILTKFYCVGDNNQFYFTILDGKLRWAWDATGCQDGANFYETGVTVVANVWQHVAVKHTPSGVTIYYNGSPIPGTLIQGAYGSMLNSSEPLRIGVYKTITGNWFGQYSGLMDDVRIWDAAISDANILARYNSPLTGAEPNLAGYYTMDLSGSGAGTIVPNEAASAVLGSTDGVSNGTGNSPAFINSTSGITNSLFSTDTTICDGESLLLNAGGYAGDYLWQDGSTDTSFTVTQPGLYHVLISNGCEVFGDSIQVSYAPIPSVFIGNDTLLCQGQSLNLDASNVVGASGYIWQDSSLNSNFLVNDPGQYSVFVNVGGCQGYDEIFVDYSTLQLDLGPSDSIVCSGASLSLDVSQPNTSYTWQDGSTLGIYAVQNDGLYSVTISDGTCILSDSINVIYNEVTANFNYETTAQCGSTPVIYQDISSTNFGIVESFTWFVDGKQAFFGANPIQMVTSSASQSIKLQATSSSGCTDEYTSIVNVEVFEVPNVNFVTSVISPKIDEEIYFENTSVNVDSFFWKIENNFSTFDNSFSYSFNEDGIYLVELTGFNDLCSTKVHKYINVKPPLRYYVPNAFTPFNGQNNQIFTPIFTSGFDPYNYSLTVYNKWGEILFLSNDANIGWNGFYGSEQAKNGVYIWQIKYFDVELNKRVTENGTVTLVH